MKRTRGCGLGVAVLAAALAGLPGGMGVCLGQTALAGDGEAEPQSALRVTTRLVQLNVIAQDKRGRPVSGLTSEDFQLTDNGRPQKIAVFAMESSRATENAAATGGMDTANKSAPNIFANRSEPEFRTRAGTGASASVTVILFDTLNTSFRDQSYAKAEILGFLRQLRPQDHVAIYLLSRRLAVINEFTQDAAALLQAVERLQTSESILQTNANQPFVTPDDTGFVDPKAAMRAANLLNEMNTTLSDVANVQRIQITAQALEGIANHIAGVPGRKNLIWVSGSFPVSISMRSNERSPVDMKSQDFTARLERVARTMSEANVAIYPVDAHGLVVPADFDASTTHPLGENATPFNTPASADEQATMRMLAERTGGRAFINTNDIQGAIRTTLADSQLTYQMGFYPEQESWDGKFHQLRLRAKKAGLTLQYRKGYFAQTENTGEARDARAALQTAVWSPVDASGVGLTAKVESINPATRKLELRINVDASELRFVEGGGRHLGKLDALYLQLGPGDAELAAEPLTYTINFDDKEYRRALERGYLLKAPLTVPSETRALRIVVRDGLSGDVGSLTIPLEKFLPPQTSGRPAQTAH